MGEELRRRRRILPCPGPNGVQLSTPARAGAALTPATVITSASAPATRFENPCRRMASLLLPARPC